MAREDWRDLESERLRRLRDRDRDLEDYGQADYSDLYGYDPARRTGYRAYDNGRRDAYDDGRPYDDRGLHEGRSYADDRRRARDEWDYGPERRRSRRDGPSDRVLWAVIMERLEDERRLDISNVDVDVHDGEVTLNGTVRRKADKRRIEDIADIEGVHNVQNNLRVREHRRWMFL
jgi:hypothetical protein